MRTSLPILAPLLLAASSVTAGFDNVFHNSILNARGPLPATLPNNESKMAMLLHRRDLSDGVNGFNKMVKTRKVGTLQARYLNAKPHIEERDGEDEEEEDSCEAEDGSEDVDNDGDCYKEDSEGDKTGLNLNATVQISLSGKNPTVSGAKLVANASTSGTAVSSPSLSSVLVVSPSSSSVIVASPSPSSVIVASPSSSSGIVASPSASSIVVSASASASTSTFAAPAANVTAPSINVTTPANIAEDSFTVADGCIRYHNVTAGEYCLEVITGSKDLNLTLDQFYCLNPAVHDNCDNLQIDESYCTGYGGEWPSD